ARPFPPPRRPDTPSPHPAPACRGTAGSGAGPPRSGSFLYELHQVRRQRGLHLTSYHHAVPFFLDDELLTCLALVGVRVVAARMSTAALGPLQRGTRGRLRNDQEGSDVDRRMPAGIVLAAPTDSDLPSSSFQPLELGERGFETALVADDAGVALHDGLERRLHGERILAAFMLERGEGIPHRRFHIGVGNRRGCPALGRGVQPGPAPEDPQVAPRIPAPPVGPVHAAPDLARRVETRN